MCQVFFFCFFKAKIFIKNSVSSGKLWQEMDKIVEKVKKGNEQGKSFSFNVFLATIVQYSHTRKLNMAALARFSILSLLANTFRLFVFCFLQPSTDPCNDFSSLE